MWLRIFFGSDKRGLLAVVGRDGNVYFKATDVGALMGYIHPWQFAKTYAITNLKKQIRSSRNLLVFDFSEMMRIIEKCVDRPWAVFERERIQTMKSLWSFGSVPKFFPDILSDSPTRAFKLTIRMGAMEEGRICVTEWLTKFSERAMKEMFE